MATAPPRHEPAPALSVLLLDQMHAYQGWDLDPEFYIVYADRLGRVPLPPLARRDHPRVMVARMAKAYEEGLDEMPPKPPDMVGVAFMFETWDVAFHNPAERAEWKRRDFSEHPRAVEARLLLAFQPGHPPVWAVHQRDTRNTGQRLHAPQPRIGDAYLGPGSALPSLIPNLERICRVMAGPPSTFRRPRR